MALFELHCLLEHTRSTPPRTKESQSSGPQDLPTATTSIREQTAFRRSATTSTRSVDIHTQHRHPRVAYPSLPRPSLPGDSIHSSPRCDDPAPCPLNFRTSDSLRRVARYIAALSNAASLDTAVTIGAQKQDDHVKCARLNGTVYSSLNATNFLSVPWHVP